MANIDPLLERNRRFAGPRPARAPASSPTASGHVYDVTTGLV